MLVATATALGAGVIVGLARGGRLTRLAYLQVRLPWLVAIAWLVQVVLFVSPLASLLSPWAAVIHLSTVVMLAVVVYVNRTLPGLALLGLGLLLNATVYAVNGGFMPVSEFALVASGNAASIADMAGGARYEKTFLQQPDTPLWLLGDILPLPPVRKIYSVGDVVAALGVLVMVVHGMSASRES